MRTIMHDGLRRKVTVLCGLLQARGFVTIRPRLHPNRVQAVGLTSGTRETWELVQGPFSSFLEVTRYTTHGMDSRDFPSAVLMDTVLDDFRVFKDGA